METHVTVRVVDHLNRPVSGAMFVINESPVPMPEIALITNDAGEIHLNLPAGRYCFRASAYEATGELWLELENTKATSIELMLKRHPTGE